ncbi:hypothetical protein [Cupriavidus alkaliphilus]|uniref:Uncharacterized protein n=1 Tax=Cupriavidus alkaliphilus TaxID=942866 RepID=A0A7W4YT84_9BURK|nr:hypothetical protein [Cupriavidus alkaliphilus]MBB3010635.1 hypothetical protein [Cupriavidus alkaliphilus]
MGQKADYPVTYRECDLERFETAPSLGAGIHRVRGSSGVHTFFVNIQQGLPLAIRVDSELHRDAPAGASIVSVLAPKDVTTQQAEELNRILETVLALAAPPRISLSDVNSLVARLPVFDFVKGLVSQ